MASGRDGRGSNEGRRPLLGGGEKLAREVTRAQKPGPKFHPFSLAETHRHLAPQAETLGREVRALASELTAEHVIVEATLLPNYLAASYFPDETMRRHSLYMVGARQGRAPYKTRSKTVEDQPTKTLIIAGHRADIEALAREISAGPGATAESWGEIREIYELGLPVVRKIVKKPPHRADADIITWEAVLNPIGRTPNAAAAWSMQAFEKWVSWIERLQGRVAKDYRRVVGGLTFVPISMNVGNADLAAQFNLLRTLRPMPELSNCPEAFTRAVVTAARVRPHPANVRPKHDVPVAIFDGGVDPALPHLAPFVRVHDVTPEPVDPQFQNHGTMVTTALLYGVIDPNGPLPQPITMIDHFRVFPLPPPPAGTSPDTRTYWLLDQIVAKVHEHTPRIVNLSLGPDDQVEDDGEPSRWTAELDQLVSDVGPTVGVAPGNNGNAPEGHRRILIPADMVNGITIGACDERGPHGRIRRASYSPVGPGREGRQSGLAGVGFGGEIGGQGFVGLDRRGRVIVREGTSLATPLTLRGIVELAGELGEDRARPDVLRAFSVHHTERPRRGLIPNEIGFGRFPESYESIWECAPEECVVLYEAALERSGPTGLQFPIPTGLPGDVELELRWTLSFVSEVDPKDPADYTRSGLEITFRLNDRLRTINDPKTRKPVRVVHLDEDRDEIAALLASGSGDLSENPPAHQGWRKYKTESERRNAGKWETLIHGRCKRPVSEIARPRLDVSYLYRRNGELVSDQVPPLSVALLLTMKAPPGIALYDSVRSQFSVLTPVRITLPASNAG